MAWLLFRWVTGEAGAPVEEIAEVTGWAVEEIGRHVLDEYGCR